MEPATQAVHPVLAVAVQVVLLLVPAAHVEQTVQAAVPDVVVLSLPAAQLRHVDPEQYLPAAHVAQASCLAND